jgi:hypothetical protein
MILLTTLLLALTWHAAGAADFVVVANPASGVEKLSKDEVINIYMGRDRKLPGGIAAMPIDQANPVSEKARFYSVMVGKELAEVQSYWARLRFSGQGQPPRQASSAEEALDWVAGSKGAIAYVDRKKVDKRVKVVFDPNQASQ